MTNKKHGSEGGDGERGGGNKGGGEYHGGNFSKIGDLFILNLRIEY